jgi:predicted ATPase
MRLLEREPLLERLTGELEHARTRGRLVLIAGEAGAGKSALVESPTDLCVSAPRGTVPGRPRLATRWAGGLQPAQERTA